MQDNYSHIPFLYHLIKKEYFEHLKSDYINEKDGNISNEIKIENFPVTGVILRVGYTINFRFENNIYFKKFKEKFKKEISNDLYNNRVFWNSNVISIYESSDTDNPVDDNGIRLKANRFFKIINLIRNKYLNSD